MSARTSTARDSATDRRRPGRITVEESFLDLIDQLAYGDLEAWRRVYAAAEADPAVRQEVSRAAGMVDPDFASAGRLWRALIERMPAAEAGQPTTQTALIAGD